MRVLVTYGSKRGGTAEIASVIATSLRERGLEVDCIRASGVRDVAGYDAVVAGGALYARRWVREARRFVTRHAAELRARPVWMFSSGPLDDSASRIQLPAVPRVAALMARVGARGHATFGGRLAPDARGFPASVMAKTHAGDYRDWGLVRAWALQVADDLASEPCAVRPVEQPRGLLAALCLAVGTLAVAGGALLVARPDGSLLRVPPWVLDHVPLASLTIPGVVLALVVGAVNLIAGALVLRASRKANAAALAGGAAVLAWVATELVVLGLAHPLQLVSLLLAIAIMTEAIRRRTRRELPGDRSPSLLRPA